MNEKVQNAIEILKVRGDCLRLDFLGCRWCPHGKKRTTYTYYCNNVITIDYSGHIKKIDKQKILQASIKYLAKKGYTEDKLFEELL